MRRNQKGNALFLILIAVALFAALSYAVTQSGRGGSGVDKEEAAIKAAQILQYGTSLEQAIIRLQIINGCSDTEISFERSPFDGSDTHLVNSNSPDDFSCHVFHSNGGDMTYTDYSLGDHFVTTSFQSHRNIKNIGTYINNTNSADLFYVVGSLPLQTCLELNKRAGIDNPGGAPPQTLSNTAVHFSFGVSPASMFKGTYVLSRLMDDPFTGKNFACMEASSGFYEFYYVLIAR